MTDEKKDTKAEKAAEPKTPKADTQEPEFVENPRYGVKVSDED